LRNVPSSPYYCLPLVAPALSFISLALHAALPIWDQRRARPAREVVEIEREPLRVRDDLRRQVRRPVPRPLADQCEPVAREHARLDRKSRRLNSSHVKISYAVFCLKQKAYLLVIPE